MKENIKFEMEGVKFVKEPIRISYEFDIHSEPLVWIEFIDGSEISVYSEELLEEIFQEENNDCSN